jgi:hypothetical protein
MAQKLSWKNQPRKKIAKDKQANKGINQVKQRRKLKTYSATHPLFILDRVAVTRVSKM